MDAIQDISLIETGDILHHPALGFAVVEEVDRRGVGLRWERPGGNHPHRASRSALEKGYRVCVPGGFLSQSVHSPAGLRQLTRRDPVRAVKMLLDDLDGPQGLDDIEEWMHGRNVIPSANFEQWWADIAPALERDPEVHFRRKQIEVDAPSLPDSDATPAVVAEAFLGLSPKARYELARQLDDDARKAAIAASARSGDSNAVLVLLRGQETVPAALVQPLLDMAREGEPRIAAALLLRSVGEGARALAGLAADFAYHPLIREAIRALPRKRQAVAVLELMERALADNGDGLAAAFLAKELPPNCLSMPASTIDPDDPITIEIPQFAIGPAEEMRWPSAVRWLRMASNPGDTMPPVDTPNGTLLDQLAPLPADRALDVAIAMARALSLRHAQGTCGGIQGARFMKDGTVSLGLPEDSSPQRDVRDAMRAVLTACVGQLPRGRQVTDNDLLTHLCLLAPGLPPELVAVAIKAMAYEPNSRPPNGLALQLALEQARTICGVRQGAPARPNARLVVGHDTHIGLLKSRISQVNQDALFWHQDGPLALLLVADGISVSTAGSGNLASAILVQVIASIWEQQRSVLLDADEQGVRDFLDHALASANTAICDAARRLASGDLTSHIPMGTTAMVAVVKDGVYHLASLGDSRTFVVTRAGAALLTGDQNQKSEWMLGWQLGQAPQLINDGRALVGYAGHFDEYLNPSPVPPRHTTVALLPGETILMCSDGLTDYARTGMAAMAHLIEEAARADDLGAACRRLTDEANAAGGGDNITVLMARLAGPSDASPASRK